MSKKYTLIPDTSEIDGRVREVDEIEKRLLEKLDKLERVKEEGRRLPEEGLSDYEDPETGYVVTMETVEEEGTGGFMEGMMGKYVTIRSTVDRGGYEMEGYYERFDEKGAVGYFRRRVEGAEVFGETRGYGFEGYVRIESEERVVVRRVGKEAGGGEVAKVREKGGGMEVYGVVDREGEMVEGGEVFVRIDGAKVYTSMVGGKYSGPSVVVREGGVRFEGILEDLRYKRGVLWYNGKEGPVYEGEFDQSGRPSGEGVLRHGGLVYEGHFEAGLMQGECQYRNSETGEVFRGTFKDNVIVGRGVHEIPGKFKYEGEFLDGRYNGHGRFTYENGSIFEGEFKDGRFEGIGRIITTQGDVLEGKFADWNPAGELKMKNSKGENYQGKFKDKEKFDGDIVVGGSKETVDFSGDVSEMVRRDFESLSEKKSNSSIESNPQSNEKPESHVHRFSSNPHWYRHLHIPPYKLYDPLANKMPFRSCIISIPSLFPRMPSLRSNRVFIAQLAVLSSISIVSSRSYI